MKKFKLPLAAAGLAIAITAIMDFNGYWMFSAFSLIGLTAIFWIITKMPKTDFGLLLGGKNHYGVALLYPLLVLGFTALIALLSGDFSLQKISWLNLTLASTVGIIGALITEEAFFRGWLWGAFCTGGMSPKRTLFVTSIIFTIWHISAVTSGTEFGLPWHQVPVYLVNATLIGLIWGLLRLWSGSIFVSSVSHAVWNAFAYELFGFGEKIGSLGITNTIVFGPEIGLLGILLNGGFFLWLWQKCQHKLNNDSST